MKDVYREIGGMTKKRFLGEIKFTGEISRNVIYEKS